ncbi:MAG: dihydroorotase [Oscillospiraceae bacterium]
MVLLFKKIRLIDPYLECDDKFDVLIKDGIIKEIGQNLFYKNAKVIMGKNLLMTSGFLDIHVHLRDPGFTYKEDILTGSKSGAAGGFTALCPMPNTYPVTDNIKTVNYILDKAKKADCRIYPTAAITEGELGYQFTNFKDLIDVGVVAFTDDGRPVENNLIMENALKIAKDNDILVMSHCEDLKIIDGGIINKGEVSERLNVKGMDRESEDKITKREIELAKKTGARLHICHVSTKGSVQAIRDGKKQGVNVTGETCPHYFSLTDKALLNEDADYRMNPPLREDDDLVAIIDGLKDGTIDAITTDHAPHSLEDKENFLLAPNGVIGLETSFAAAYTYLVENGHLTLNQLINKLTINPYKIINKKQSNIQKGNLADITVIDLDEKWVVDIDKMHSKSKNAVFKGKTLKSKVIYTMCDGKETFSLI